MYERTLTRRIRDNRRSILVLGPRQVGKSTLLRELQPDLIVNLASPSTYRDYITHPERLENELRSANSSIRIVLLDEIQRVPELLDVVQVIVDEQPRRFRFLLSGSSARKLRSGRANLLPGRVDVHYLHPLLAAELGSDFDLDRVLAQGTLPGVYAEERSGVRARMLRSYTDTYLREEVQAEALVRDVGGYSRLLDLVAASSGRIINLSALCRDAGVSYETARRYMEILKDTLVTFTVPAWSGSDRASLILHPKVFLFDLGVRNALLRRPLGRVLPDEKGYLLEHLVAYEIHRRLGEPLGESSLFYFRTRHGAEIDFVLQVGRELWGIEVKSSRNVTRADLAGFEALSSRTQRLKRKVVLFLGPRRMSLDEAEVIPLDEFLQELPV